MTAKTLYDKLWDEHVIKSQPDGTTLLYIDRHLVHEVTSPQAFEGLAEMHRKPWRMTSVVATTDHNTPTTGWDKGLDGIEDPISKLQVTTLIDNLKKNPPAAFFPFLSRRQGIIHVIGPEEGATLPGMTIVCGDSHTSTHGALGTLAMGIGTSEVEHVLATQSLLTKKNKNMLVRVEGKLQPGITGKDIALAFIGRVGTAGGTGCTIEFAGSAIRGLSMEGRMTLCNMAIEAGGKNGIFPVDEQTKAYLEEHSKKEYQIFEAEEDAEYEQVVTIDLSEVRPTVAFPHLPGNAKTIDEIEAMEPIKIDQVVIGSCTNGRMEDMRKAAAILKGHTVHPDVRVMVIPATQKIYKQCIKEGLLDIFVDAGCAVNTPSCGPCMGGHMGVMAAGERCVSTTNRNFVGRMGHVDSLIYLASPEVAAASAIAGYIANPERAGEEA